MADFSLATQIQPPQIQTPGQMAQGAGQVQQLQKQNALRQVMQQPGAVGPDGSPSPNALKAISSIDPMIGSELQQNSLKTQGMRADLTQQKQGMVFKGLEPVLTDYEADLAKGTPEPVASANAQKKFTEVRDSFAKSGLFSDAEIRMMPTDFSAPRVRTGILGYKGQQDLDIKRRAEARQEHHTSVEERQREEALDIQRRAAGNREYDKPQELTVTRDGKPETVLAQQDKRTGGWVTADEKRTPISAESIRKSADVRAADKAEAGRLEDAEVKLMSQQYLAGDKTVFANLGRGGQGSENIKRLRGEIARQAAEANMSGADIAAKMAEFAGITAGERTLGQRTAQIGMAVSEAKMMAPLALEASNKVDRTKFPTLNSLLLSAEKGTGGEEVVQFGIATNSLINIYARAISPTGVPTVSDKDHARELLATAWTKGQYKAGVDQLMKELNAASQAPGIVRKEFRDAVHEGKEPVSGAASTVPPSKDAAIPEIKTKEERDKLPAGARYRVPGDDPNGPPRVRR